MQSNPEKIIVQGRKCAPVRAVILDLVDGPDVLDVLLVYYPFVIENKLLNLFIVFHHLKEHLFAGEQIEFVL